MSRTARVHDRENAPRELRTRDSGTPRSTAQRAACGVQHGYWHTGDPIARGAKRENEQDAANAPRIGNTANRRALRRPIGESAIT